ncbi:hypothetical protein CBM2634_B20118 [Cupriavidus taiwanensis]|uniref:Uncharacterized protein n=1 Tax=Cupriavidus taiwanensis TaxID=164546 RepID=A0A375J9H1_9BURK|nr:hypothetical protein CBM2634_B20118 [Cupriavidus taiwanensis]
MRALRQFQGGPMARVAEAADLLRGKSVELSVIVRQRMDEGNRVRAYRGLTGSWVV